MWARSDYFPIAGIHDALIDNLGLRKQYPGSTQMAGTINDPQYPGGWPFPITAAPRGTANTTFMSQFLSEPIADTRPQQLYPSDGHGKPAYGSTAPVSA